MGVICSSTSSISDGSARSMVAMTMTMAGILPRSSDRRRESPRSNEFRRQNPTAIGPAPRTAALTTRFGARTDDPLGDPAEGTRRAARRAQARRRQRLSNVADMQAALITDQETLELVEFDDPVPTDDQIVVDIAYCGVCGTDVHAYQTPGPANP